MPSKFFFSLAALALIFCSAASCSPPQPLDYLNGYSFGCDLRGPQTLRGEWYLALELPTNMIVGTEQTYTIYSYETSPERFTAPKKKPPYGRVCKGELIIDERAYDGPVKVYRRRDSP